MRSFLPDAPTADQLRAKLGNSYAWVVLIVISGGGIASILTSTSFTVAIPAVMAEFGLGHDVVQLAMSAYMAAMTVAMLPAAWLFERFGMRRCFLASMSFMLIVSALGSFSTSFGFLVAIRMAQGAAAGMMGPMGTIAVMRLFPPELQGRAWGVIGFAVVLAPAIAPAMGGFLVDGFGWPSIFWINIPFCIVALLAAYFLLPLVPARTQHGPDWLGLLLLAVASLAIIAAATLIHSAGLRSWPVLSAAAMAIVAVGLFVLHAKRVKHPIVSPAIFRHRKVAMGAFVAVIYGAGLYGSTYLVPLFLQSVLRNTASDAGMALLPAGVTLAIAMLIGGWWVDHGSPRLISMFGLLLFGASFFVMWIFAASIDYRAVVLATVVSRIGLGVLLPALNLGTLRSLEGSEMGQATVFLNYLRQLGGMLGVASIAVYVEWRSRGILANGIPLHNAELTAFAEGFLMIAVAFAVSVLAAARMREEPGH